MAESKLTWILKFGIVTVLPERAAPSIVYQSVFVKTLLLAQLDNFPLHKDLMYMPFNWHFFKYSREVIYRS